VVADGGHDLDVRVPGEQLAHALSYEEVVLSEYDANRHGPTLTGLRGHRGLFL